MSWCISDLGTGVCILQSWGKGFMGWVVGWSGGQQRLSSPDQPAIGWRVDKCGEFQLFANKLE